MDQSETIIIITPGFPRDELDTTCLPAHQNFVKSLNRVCPRLKIIIVSIQYPPREDCYQWHGNSVISLNGKRIPKIFRPLLWLKIYQQIKKINRPNILGILSFWCLEGAFVGSCFAKRNNLLHLSWLTGQDARKGNLFIKLIKPKAGALVAMSDLLVDEFEKNYFIRPQYVVPNGINTGAFPDQKTEKSIDLFAAGSLIPLKQYSMFIDVVAELVKVKPLFSALLCGAGPEEEMLKKKIASLKLENNLKLTGEVPHEQVLVLMRQSKVFLHPSIYEGYSTVCLEALYAGCHVVSFISPEKIKVSHWHIVMTQSEMIAICKNLLNESDFNSVLVHDMDDCARKMIEIFDYKETITL